MANTFLFARGAEIGASLAERDLADTAREIEARAATAGCRIHLQSDAVVAGELAVGAASQTVDIDAIPADRMILDIGPGSVDAFAEVMAGARTLVWNGPVGAFEFSPFDAGTVALARRSGGAHGGRPFCRWPAAATPWRRWRRPGWSSVSAMCRPPAVPSWSGWRARPCQGSPP